MPGLAVELALPDPALSRRRFDTAAASFASASFMHDEARRRLLERLEGLRVEPRVVVDLGAALGEGARQLARIFPDAEVLALDLSRCMLERAGTGSFTRLAARVERLPLRDGSVDLLFANLLLPWTRPEALFAEARRVLSSDGVLLFSTFGPETLVELRRAWSGVDAAIHVHAFWDVQTVGDLAVAAGLEEPVLDVDRIGVTYGELSSVVRDLRSCGATNTAPGRRRGLMGRSTWQRFVEALWRDQGEGESGRLHVTVELILGQAFGSRAVSRRGPAGEIVVPLEALGRRS